MVSIRITYTRPSELRADLGQAGGALLVKIDETADLAFDMPLAIELVLPDGALLRTQAKVLQVLAGFGVAVSLDGGFVEQALRRAVGDDPPGAYDARHERIDRKPAGTYPPRRLPTEPPVRTQTSSRPPVGALGSSRTRPANEPSRTPPPDDPFYDSSRSPPPRTSTSSRPPSERDPMLDSTRTPGEPARTATTSRPPMPIDASRTATSTRRPGEYSERPPVETARTSTVSRPPMAPPRTSTSSRPPDLAKGSTPAQPLPDPPHRTPTPSTPPHGVPAMARIPSASTPPRSVSSEIPVRPPTEPPPPEIEMSTEPEPPEIEISTEPEPADAETPAPEDDERPRRADAKRYDELTHTEKIQLALHGSRDDRAHILRDKNRALHPFVLKNPQIDLEDVTNIAKNAQMAPEVLKQIADRKEWFQRPAIATALARNPKTPAEVAVRALDHVPVEALRQMAKGVGVPPHVAQAARKKVVG
jgi:hypothetical protein